MALVTFEGYDGSKFEINPAFVTSVVSYNHFDHDMVLPDELMITNPDGNPEVSNDPEKLAQANELRTSERVIINDPTGSHIVKGSIDEVKKALGEEDKPAPRSSRSEADEPAHGRTRGG